MASTDTPELDEPTGYAGPPSSYELPALAKMAGHARRWALAATIIGFAQLLAKGLSEHHNARIAELTDECYRAGHRAGWFERGEELDPADRAELAELAGAGHQDDEPEPARGEPLPATGLQKARAIARGVIVGDA